MLGLDAEFVFVSGFVVESLDALVYGAPRSVVVGFDEQHGLQRVEPVGDAQLGCDGPFPDRIIVVLVACAERKSGYEEQYDVFSHGFPCRFIV
ncbi:MAG: hypothetical protein BHV65_15760 [Alistipes sp. 58_9_plus]|nr:MAG: hypothetical protein BHV65_15760 [Alistipes sp. 58_9_plus]